MQIQSLGKSKPGPPPAEESDQEVTDALSLVRDLHPVLADSGRIYCLLGPTSSFHELHRRAVSDLLTFRYRDAHARPPRRRTLDLAKALVHGELCRPTSRPHLAHCVTRLIVAMATTRENVESPAAGCRRTPGIGVG